LGTRSDALFPRFLAGIALAASAELLATGAHAVGATAALGELLLVSVGCALL